jgi:hypothetical protein
MSAAAGMDPTGQLLNLRASVRSLVSNLDGHQQPRSQPGFAVVESDNGREGDSSDNDEEGAAPLTLQF